MLNFNFELNDMQKKAKALQGQSVVFDAPTGSGKTEACLLALKPGSTVSYLLPTITSANFMYKRLCANFPNINVGIRTSLITDLRAVSGAYLTIEICVPDAPMISFLDQGIKSLQKAIVLDEFDNYPDMVKTAILEYIKVHQPQVIVASATLDKGVFEEYQKISYQTDLVLDKHKLFSSNASIESIIQESLDNNRKIGIICNSITGMENIQHLLPENGIFHHSQLDEYTRLQNEERLFNGDFDIVLSNDLISYSVDIDFDVLIVESTDNLGLMIQRFGRVNRQNKEVDFNNTYILPPKNCTSVPFVDGFASLLNYEKLTAKDVITYQEVQSLRNELSRDEYPTLNDIQNYWIQLREAKKELVLRYVPHTFKLPVKVITKAGTVDTFKLLKVNGEFPWSWYPCSEEFKDRDIVHIKGQNYLLTDKDSKGIYTVQPYDGEGWEYIPLETVDFARKLREDFGDRLGEGHFILYVQAADQIIDCVTLGTPLSYYAGYLDDIIGAYLEVSDAYTLEADRVAKAMTELYDKYAH